MNVGTLVGYFAKHDEARRSLRELARQGFSRIALVHKGLDGEVHIADPFLWRRALGVISIMLTALSTDDRWSAYRSSSRVKTTVGVGPAPIVTSWLHLIAWSFQ